MHTPAACAEHGAGKHSGPTQVPGRCRNLKPQERPVGRIFHHQCKARHEAPAGEPLPYSAIAEFPVVTSATSAAHTCRTCIGCIAVRMWHPAPDGVDSHHEQSWVFCEWLDVTAVKVASGWTYPAHHSRRTGFRCGPACRYCARAAVQEPCRHRRRRQGPAARASASHPLLSGCS